MMRWIVLAGALATGGPAQAAAVAGTVPLLPRSETPTPPAALPEPEPEQEPELTEAEKLTVAEFLLRCWSMVDLSPAAAAARVEVAFALSEDGIPVEGSFEMRASEGNALAAGLAYEAAVRTLTQCSPNGLPLPPERGLAIPEMVAAFGPDEVQIR